MSLRFVRYIKNIDSGGKIVNEYSLENGETKGSRENVTGKPGLCHDSDTRLLLNDSITGTNCVGAGKQYILTQKAEICPLWVG